MKPLVPVDPELKVLRDEWGAQVKDWERTILLSKIAWMLFGFLVLFLIVTAVLSAT